MELVYLWVEDYKNIHQQGFNFSPRFTCKYEDGKLTIDKKEHVEDFFGKNINVTAIVGENGSGKSNLLNLLFNEHILNNVFFILRRNTELKVYGIDLDTVKYPNSTIKEEQLIDKTFHCTNLRSGKLNNYKLAFYTPLLQDSFTDNKEKFNLSPVSLLDEYQESDQVYKDIKFENLYGIYKSNAIQDSIDMIKNCQNLNLPFDIPNKLTISISIITEYEKYLPQYDFLKNKVKSEDTFYGYMEQRIIKNWFHNSFKNFYSEIKEVQKASLLEPIKTNFGDKYCIDTLIKILPKLIKEGVEEQFIDDLHDDLQNIKNFLDAIKGLANNQTGNSLKLNISNIPNDFISKYNKVIKSCSAFLDFDWKPQLSSGQQTFLSQFSLFYKYLKNNDKTLLFIDEGESTLHPNWQKMYVKYIIGFFQKNMRSKKIHIIFSSHSPFILSDLPKENVIFLDKYKETDEEVIEKKQKAGNCKNVSKTIDIQPFGANIHTLLSHGFFMKDGLMGEFAKGKINEAIKLLNQKTLNEEEISYCENIISIIGEPILKRHLQKMLDSKRLSEVEQIKKQIKELQDELAKKEDKKNA